MHTEFPFNAAKPGRRKSKQKRWYFRNIYMLHENCKSLQAGGKSNDFDIEFVRQKKVETSDEAAKDTNGTAKNATKNDKDKKNPIDDDKSDKPDKPDKTETTKPEGEPTSSTEKTEVPTVKPEVPTVKPEVPTVKPEVPTGKSEVPTGKSEVPTGKPEAAEPTKPTGPGNNSTKKPDENSGGSSVVYEYDAFITIYAFFSAYAVLTLSTQS